MTMSSNIDLSTSRVRPLHHSNGVVLDDYETAKEALKCIADFEAKNKKPTPIAPKFVEWLRKGIEFVDNKEGSFVDYKQRTIQKQFDYDLIIANTEKANQKLEKKGMFDAKVMKKIKGVSK